MVYSYSMRRFFAFFLALPLPLAAQLPPDWQHQERLGAGLEKAPAWWGGGLWTGDGHGPSATLEDSLGLGNAITGTGAHLEGGFRAGHWDLAAEGLAVRTPEGQEYFTLYRSHVWWQGASGWQAGFEQEPLVWGYGLNGGYLLGESARPFPRMRIESPYEDIHIFRVPLGRWGFQAFMGRLEDHRVLSSSIQDASWRSRAIVSAGDPQAPLLNGYRVQAKFGSSIDFYINYLNLWGGTLNGVAMTQGYGVGDYLTSMFGLKDTLAEATHDPNTQPESTPYKNRGRSGSEIDWGLRVDAACLARPLGAQHVWLQVARGSKGLGWPIGTFVKNPVKYGAKDIGHDAQNLFTGKYGFGWNYDARYATPSELTPNDCVGVLVDWSRVRFGLEYLDTTNSITQGHRTFAHTIYLTGFYYYGDPLGEAQAGEARIITARLETDLTRRLSTASWLVWGKRPFRDQLDLWQEDHPGATAGDDRIFELQQTFKARFTKGIGLEAGAAWERHGAEDYEVGRTGNGFRYFANLSYRWPSL
jgi:hypothetical protein